MDKLMNFNKEFYHEFSRDWQTGWNSHDLGLIMKHYRSDIVFRSQKAMHLMGTGEIIGVEDLRRYWAAALKRQPKLYFTINNVFSGHQMMVISYRNQSNILAAETLYFDESGQVFQAAACHASPR
jgi:hypothetical protein